MIRIGIIGLGRLGKLHYLNLLRIPHVKLVAVCDLYDQNLVFASHGGVRCYKDYKRMLDEAYLDGLVLSTPHSFRYEPISLCAAKGIDVFVDKPLATSTSEANSILTVVRENQTQLMVGANFRYFPSVRRLKSMVQAGNFGRIIASAGELVLDGLFVNPVYDPAADLDWRMDPLRSGGGALMNLGYHLIDLYLSLFGPLEFVSGRIESIFNLPVEDYAMIVLRSKDGVEISMNVGLFAKSVTPKFTFRISILGTALVESTDAFAPRNLTVHAAKQIITNLGRRAAFRPINYLAYTYYYSSYYEVMRDFVMTLVNGDNVPIPAETQLPTIALIEKIYGALIDAKNGSS